MRNSYPSKLLLFGEYAVIAGGEGFAIPYPKYNSVWTQAHSSNEIGYDLGPFYKYLKTFENVNSILDLEKFRVDLENNFYLKSDIPIGMGLGSSGSVVAAIYDRYAKQVVSDLNRYDLKLLRSQLAVMENFFHETSSGLDPLVILIDQPIHLLHGGEMRIIQDGMLLLNEIDINLVDTKVERKASTLITHFTNKMQEAFYQSSIQNRYLPLVSACINTLLNKDKKEFYHNLTQLSLFQLEHFAFAIPESIRGRWTTGLKTGKEIFKLCGAGGGGFMLCFNAPSIQ